jgi:7-carboxy-7-deazaguanine synthase
MKLNLINNGIFPIIYDENGKEIQKNELDTGLTFAGTIQGEGMYQGMPSLFIRTSGCNLKCLFTSKNKKHNLCDTAYSSFNPENNKIETEVIEKIIRNNIGNIKHLVITGGEPMLQAKALIELLKRIGDLNLLITLETNGTIFDKELAQYIDLFSISPKLSNSNPTFEKLKDIGKTLSFNLINQHIKKRNNEKVLWQFCNYCLSNNKQIQFKFVITCKEDIEEIKNEYEVLINSSYSLLALPHTLASKNPIIYLMPEGITEEELKEKNKWLIGECIKNNYRFCNRLHIEIYGGKVRFV